MEGVSNCGKRVQQMRDCITGGRLKNEPLIEKCYVVCAKTWEETVVLSFLLILKKNLHPPSKLTLRELTLKLVMLVSLVSGQRGQSIQLLDINCMSQTETSCTFVITQNVKQSRPGIKQPVNKLEAYSMDDRLCVVTLLKEVLL